MFLCGAADHISLQAERLELNLLAPKKRQCPLYTASPFPPMKGVLYQENCPMHAVEILWWGWLRGGRDKGLARLIGIEHNADSSTCDKNSGWREGRSVVLVVAYQNFSYKHPREPVYVGSLYISNTATLYTHGKRAVTLLLPALSIHWNVNRTASNIEKEQFMWESSSIPEHDENSSMWQDIHFH